MTSVNMTPDDIGLQRLRADNDKPASTHNVSATTPARPVQKNRAPDEKIQPIKSERRSHKERRKGDRRLTPRTVLLDTRSYRERRSNQGNRKQDQHQILQSIDIKI